MVTYLYLEPFPSWFPCLRLGGCGHPMVAYREIEFLESEGSPDSNAGQTRVTVSLMQVKAACNQ